jgi:hypothetical protein
VEMDGTPCLKAIAATCAMQDGSARQGLEAFAIMEHIHRHLPQCALFALLVYIYYMIYIYIYIYNIYTYIHIYIYIYLVYIFNIYTLYMYIINTYIVYIP